MADKIIIIKNAAGNTAQIGPSDSPTLASVVVQGPAGPPGLPGANGSTVPSQTGNTGKFLQTDGSVMSWATVDALPDQTGHSGEFLTTDGSASSWSAVNLSAYLPLAGGTMSPSGSLIRNAALSNVVGTITTIKGLGGGLSQSASTVDGENAQPFNVFSARGGPGSAGAAGNGAQLNVWAGNGGNQTTSGFQAGNGGLLRIKGGAAGLASDTDGAVGGDVIIEGGGDTSWAGGPSGPGSVRIRGGDDGVGYLYGQVFIGDTNTSVVTIGTTLVVAALGPNSAQQHTLPAVASDTFSLLGAAQTFSGSKTFASDILLETVAATRWIKSVYNGVYTGGHIYFTSSGGIDLVGGGGGDVHIDAAAGGNSIYVGNYGNAAQVVIGDGGTVPVVTAKLGPSTSQQHTIPAVTSSTFLLASTAAGGDSTGTLGALTTIKLQGNAVKSAAPNNNDILTWVTANSRWEPVAPAGGGVTSAIAGGGVTVSAATGAVTFGTDNTVVALLAGAQTFTGAKNFTETVTADAAIDQYALIKASTSTAGRYVTLATTDSAALMMGVSTSSAAGAASTFSASFMQGTTTTMLSDGTAIIPIGSGVISSPSVAGRVRAGTGTNLVGYNTGAQVAASVDAQVTVR